MIQMINDYQAKAMPKKEIEYIPLGNVMSLEEAATKRKERRKQEALRKRNEFYCVLGLICFVECCLIYAFA